MAKVKSLPLRWKIFIEHYLATRDRVESVRAAGFKGDYATLRVTACRLLTNDNIRKEIDRRLKPFVMTANQVLTGLSEIAENDIAQVFEPDGTFDLAKAKERGVSKFIKSIKRDKETGAVTGVEVYSAHEAYRDMGKFHSLFPTQIRVTIDDADKAIDEALEKHNLPKPDTFAGEPLVDSEM